MDDKLIIRFAAFVVLATFSVRASAIRIEWDRATLRLIQEDACYGRMLRLRNDNILCCYEYKGKSWVKCSTDNGRSWREPVMVTELSYGTAANPELLQLKNGRVLLFFNERPNDGQHPFAISVCRSGDNGATWTTGVTIYTTDLNPNNGCWEPAAIQLSTGEVQLFFANEYPYRDSGDQEISLMRSKDNGTKWTKPETVAYRKGYRDGMPSPLVLRSGSGNALAIEDNGNSNGMLQPAIISTTMPDNWREGPALENSKRRWWAITPQLKPDVYAGAPYLRQLPTGETLLSCHITDNGRKQPHMSVFIGDAYARNFGSRSEPFGGPSEVGEWWNSLFIKGSKTVTAISTTSVDGKGGLWTIDGTIVSR